LERAKFSWKQFQKKNGFSNDGIYDLVIYSDKYWTVNKNGEYLCYTDYTVGSKPFEISKWQCTETSWQSYDVIITCNNLIGGTKEPITTEAPCCENFELLDQTNSTLGIFSYEDDSLQSELYTMSRVGEYWTLQDQWHPLSGLNINVKCFSMSEKTCPENIFDWYCEDEDLELTVNCLN